MTTYDLAVIGLVVNATHKELANIGVQDGKNRHHQQGATTGKETIDAKGKWVIPGVVDTHIHFALKQGRVQRGDDRGRLHHWTGRLGGGGLHDLCGLRHLSAEPHAQGFPAGAHGAGRKGQLH